jgi:hypothetical protein
VTVALSKVCLVCGWLSVTLLLHAWDPYLSERYDGIRAPDGHLHGDA